MRVRSLVLHRFVAPLLRRLKSRAVGRRQAVRVSAFVQSGAPQSEFNSIAMAAAPFALDCAQFTEELPLKTIEFSDVRKVQTLRTIFEKYAWRTFFETRT